MKTRVRRRMAIGASIALLLGSMFVAGSPSAALAHAADCPAWAPWDGSSECVMPAGTAVVSGSVAIGHTLRLQTGAHLDASVSGVALTVAGDLILESGAQIEANDDPADSTCWPGGDMQNACPVTIDAAGDILMRAGSAILSENRCDGPGPCGGGSGGDITLTAGGDMTMCGPAGAQPGCGAASANPGALISAQKTTGAGDTGTGGVIRLTIGDIDAGTGAFYAEGGSTTYLAETGARVMATGTGPAGQIFITAGKSYTTEAGSVVEAGDGEGSGVQRGGLIYLVAGCELTSLGRVTSKGNDPGGDLVHLEGCDVLVGGLVESTGKAHGGTAPNSCDDVDDNLPNEIFRPGKPPTAQGCIEVWGNTITIDSTAPLAGELNADVGDGGSDGRSWIDVFALCCAITLRDGTGNDHWTNNIGDRFDLHVPPRALQEGDYITTFLIHANGPAGSDATPNTVTVKARKSTLNGTGKILQSFAINNANGSDGGTIRAEAWGAVNFDTSTVIAAGDHSGGTQGDGGHIAVQSWNAGITWQNGEGDVQPNSSGSISLTACTTVTTTGTTFNGEPVVPTTGVCDTTKPDLPGFVPIDDLVARWAACGEFSISGRKFDAVSGTGLPGWTIRVYGPAAFSATTVTGAGGAYTLLVPGPGIYTVCEVILAPGWTQVVPGPGVPCTGPGEAANGYTVELTGAAGCCTGETVTGRDFGNQRNQVTCPEDPNRAALLTRTVKPGSPIGGGGVAGDPANYLTVQAAYDAALASAQTEVIGLFSKTKENLNLGGAKALTITQCTSAEVTALDGALPVWDISNTKKLLIIGPDSVGGTIGWRLRTGGHELKSIRSNGASVAGVRIESGANSNQISFNNVASGGIGVDILSNSNVLKAGTIGPNAGAGIHIGTGKTGNSVTGMTIQGNGASGVSVEGNSNTVSSNKLNGNAPNGITVSGNTNTIQSNQSDSNTVDGYTIAGTGNIVKDDKANKNPGDGFDLAGSGQKLTGAASSSNTGSDFRISAPAAVSAPSGNKADGTSIPSASKCTGFFTNAAVLTCT